jgi:hypothetical protein
MHQEKLGPEVKKKYSKLILRCPVFDWSQTAKECSLTYENPEMRQN